MGQKGKLCEFMSTLPPPPSTHDPLIISPDVHATLPSLDSFTPFAPFRLETATFTTLGSLWLATAEPAIAAVSWIILTHGLTPPVVRADWVLSLGILALTFPAPQRLHLTRGRATIHLISQWLQLLLLLWFCGWATDSLTLYSPSVLVAWASITPCLWWLNTEATRGLYHWTRRQPAFIRHALLISTGKLGLRTHRALRKRYESGELHQLHEQDDVVSVINQYHIHDVYIALEGSAEAEIQALLTRLQNTPASIYVVPDVLHTVVVQGQLQTLDGLPLIAIRTSPFTGMKALIKRSSDLVLALGISLLTLPLLLLIACAIKLDSQGPILFFQKRLGMNGQIFDIWKFRTMYLTPHAKDLSDTTQAIRNDPRVTRIGRFLRRTSLDELPQLLNVIRGDMSLVGPRPHAMDHHHHYQPLVQAYMVRHSVRPGITGWAQIHGLRGETNTLDKMRRRIEHDIYYLQHWSLALDLHIILRTIGLIFKDAHAW
jgi:putative colanic acid biosynthesis UDP-glucose lipid carrier transferase